MSNGYLYVATGENYIKEAEKSALSLLKHKAQAKICLITNQEYSGHIFKNIKYLEYHNSQNIKQIGYLSKIVGMKLSPFEKTIFVDTDTFFCDACDELFGILDFFDLLICHDYQEDTFAFINDSPLDGYRTYNSGVIAYNNNHQVKLFLEKWEDVFSNNLERYKGDQPALMEALLFSNLKTYSLQTIYNFRFNQFLTISNGKVKILHGRHSELQKIGEIINRSTEHRSWNPRAWTCFSWKSRATFYEKLRSFVLRLFSK